MAGGGSGGTGRGPAEELGGVVGTGLPAVGKWVYLLTPGSPESRIILLYVFHQR